MKGFLNASAQAGVDAVQALFNTHQGEAAWLALPNCEEGWEIWGNRRMHSIKGWLLSRKILKLCTYYIND